MPPGNPLFTKPAAFPGTGNVNEWIKGMMIFVRRSRPQATGTEWVEAILSNTSGSARTWALQQFNNDGTLRLSPEDTLDAFKRQHTGLDDEIKAEGEMAALRQTASVDQYAHAFDTIAMRLPQMSDYDLRVRFLTGLKPAILREVRKANPTSLEQAKRLAGIQDRDYTIHTGTATARPSDAMDIDAAQVPAGIGRLTAHERERLRAANACFRCRQTGHMARDCPVFGLSNPRRSNYRPRINNLELATPPSFPQYPSYPVHPAFGAYPPFQYAMFPPPAAPAAPAQPPVQAAAASATATQGFPSSH
ncbi:hypothetical protein IWQ56_003352 [Coemansia nantahalensis]|nr:hypothetical protein IWQ56_003352 [Coemansia nantahalensis]